MQTTMKTNFYRKTINTYLPKKSADMQVHNESE